MTIYRYRATAIFSLFLFLSLTGFSSNQSSIEFFVSNNTKEINMQTAYNRLIGTEQSDLKNSMITILQKNHIDQGKFEDILGTYRMSSDKNITADNVERFDASVYQDLSDEKIFSLARKFAITFNQESVAVFVPSQAGISDITVNFMTRQPSLNTLVRILHDKLPVIYSQAFSLYLDNLCHGFDNAKVAKIEWLGSKINIEAVKKAFPRENVNYRYGKAFLVYKNRKIEQL